MIKCEDFTCNWICNSVFAKRMCRNVVRELLSYLEEGTVVVGSSFLLEKEREGFLYFQIIIDVICTFPVIHSVHIHFDNIFLKIVRWLRGLVFLEADSPFLICVLI